MAATELIEIGYVVKTHGVKGQLKITFKENIKELSKPEALFVLVKGEKIPFFIYEIEYISDTEALVLLEDVNSIEQAAKIANKVVWGKSELLIESQDESLIIDYTGYHVTDEQYGDLGKVVAFYEMSDYDLLEVIYQDRELMIPFHDNTIIEIDEEKKIILMRLPDGILEI